MGEEILQTQGPSALPAVMTQMTTSEATQRMMKTSTFKNLFYEKEGLGREYYYLRFDIHKEMESDLDLTAGMLRCLQPCKHLTFVDLNDQAGYSAMSRHRRSASCMGKRQGICESNALGWPLLLSRPSDASSIRGRFSIRNARL